MRSIIAVLLLVISFFVYCIMLAGSHGHIQFRPWMKEDCIFWGLIITPFLLALFILFFQFRKIRKTKITKSNKGAIRKLI